MLQRSEVYENGPRRPSNCVSEVVSNHLVVNCRDVGYFAQFQTLAGRFDNVIMHQVLDASVGGILKSWTDRR